MDAVKYLKERTRMCRSIISCTDCPFDETQSGHDMNCGAFTMYHPEEAVRIVEEWSKAHQVITNAMKLEAVFGYKKKQLEHMICPPRPDGWDYDEDCFKTNCDDCRKWWDEPYKEPEHE